jgi:GGDEF domain-containing protein
MVRREEHGGLMGWDTVERRRSGEHTRPLPKDFERLDRRRRAPGEEPEPLLDAETGFFTMTTLAEFIQYEIDGSAQTLRNELHVTPLCLAAVDVAPPAGADDAMRQRLRPVVHEAIRQLCRTADRVARTGDVTILLLRRTMANNLRDHFAPRLAEHLARACADIGTVTVSVGISSLVEHVARSPGHLVRMAMSALEESQRTPGRCVVYDFRTKPVT